MNHISLFSGMGGFDLAAEWMGWNNIAHCEWNPFGQRILKHYWPNAISYHDITKSDFTVHRGQVDILTGGFPCQPYSTAGKRKGKDDERHLWPEMLRAIREIQPRWVVGENVRGLTNWNGGLVFDEVQADLECQGYKITPFLLPACAVNAPHRRDRIWFVAYATGNGTSPDGCRNSDEGGGQAPVLQEDKGRESATVQPDGLCLLHRNAAHTHSEFRRERGLHPAQPETTERHAGPLHTRHDRRAWEDFPTQPPVCDGDDGLSGRLDGITFSKWRNESIKAGGNAIVPQVAYEIFKAIQAYEEKDMGIGA